MRGLKATLLAFLALGALALAPSTEARSRGDLGAWKIRLWATVTATQTTTWSAPRYYRGGDCWHRNWAEASGSETVTLKSKRTKLLLTGFASGTTVIFGYNSWAPYEFDQLLLDGTTTRKSTFASGSDPGPCGPPGDDGSDLPPVATDCGVRKRTYAADLSVPKKGWLGIGFVRAADKKNPPGYAQCPIEAAQGVTLDGITPVLARAHFSGLANRSIPEETVIGRMTSSLGQTGTRPVSGVTRTVVRLILEQPRRKTNAR